MRKIMDRGYDHQPAQVSNWSSDEDLQARCYYNDLHQSGSRYPAQDQRLMASKSLGNLSKGYRHSYAEPRFLEAKQYPRSGRVGLAAVNPY